MTDDLDLCAMAPYAKEEGYIPTLRDSVWAVVHTLEERRYGLGPEQTKILAGWLRTKLEEDR